MNMSSRFKGSLIGGLIGDCFGAPFEGEKIAGNSVLNAYFNKRTDSKFKAPFLKYTDDTALTLSLSKSLIHMKGFDSKDMAKRFVKEFFGNPNRGYGMNVGDVFVALRATEFEDVYSPARHQFGGSGSYGNGGGMRVSPVSLFCYNKSEEILIDLARKSTLITHSNRLGYNGAILQSLAVYKALQLSKPLDVDQYLNYLAQHMEAVEKYKHNEIIQSGQQEFIYVKSIDNIKKLLKMDEVNIDKVDSVLGTSVAAHYSIPTAIYVFLRALKQIPGIETENPFQRTIHLAISLGGDTDTIATMAGSIAGAFHGIEMIPSYLQRHCEMIDHVEIIADELLQVANSTETCK